MERIRLFFMLNILLLPLVFCKVLLVKRISHIVLSAWLAILLLFGGTSKEFIHLFSGHEDTVHSRYDKTGLVIENEHHHCSFLQFSLSSFVNDVQLLFVPAHYLLHTSQYQLLLVKVQAREPLTVSLRGPPIV